MRILVLNCGSSSLKFAYADVMEMRDGGPSVRIKQAGRIEGIGGPAQWAEQGAPSSSARPLRDVPDHSQAVAWLAERWTGLPIDAVGHRVVHGGRRFTATVILTPEVLAETRSVGNLAPLHNPPALAAIEACRQWLGDDIPMAAAFDTAFHRSLPDAAATYALPHTLAERLDVRRYGFHGIAHASMVRLYAEAQGLSPAQVTGVTMQLGHGCSVTAVQGGRSVDTSMGFTPLEGLVMGTRCGDLDPAIVSYIVQRDRMEVQNVDRLLNEESGLLGLSGVSAHMQAVQAAAAAGDRRAAVAIDVFCYRAKKYLGAYLAALGGGGAVVMFGGGIGEHAPAVRAKICDGMAWAGLLLDQAKNERTNGVPAGELTAIGSDASRMAVCVVGVDEEMEIARDTWQALHGVI